MNEDEIKQMKENQQKKVYESKKKKKKKLRGSIKR